MSSWLSSVAWIVVIAILGVSLWAYTQPGLVLSWEALFALCGF